MSLHDESPPHDHPFVLEVSLRWGLSVVEIQHHQHRDVTIGPGGDILLITPDDDDTPRPLFTFRDGSYTLHVGGAEVGMLRRGDQRVVALSPHHAPVTLHHRDHGELRFGELQVAFRFVPQRRRIPPQPLESIDYPWLNTLLVTVFVHVAFLAALLLHPRDARSLEDVRQVDARYTQFIVNPEKRPAPEQVRRLTAQHPRPHGSRRTAERAATTRSASPTSHAERRARDEQVVHHKLNQLFGAGTWAVLSAGSVDDVAVAAGSLHGRPVGANGTVGSGGLDLRGFRHEGTSGTETVGLPGVINTRGRAAGRNSYGAATGGLTPHRETALEVTTPEPIVEGALDKGLIRQVIRDHLAQIKYCYERELAGSPGLAGKVLVKFVVGSAGTVISATVAESTLRNATVESCMTQRVRSWVFPRPHGGGVVVVSYPFILRQGG
ncbi:MAG: AgmX/PglI C-terminal domain-containing protein [Myxococcota bacterium]